MGIEELSMDNILGAEEIEDLFLEESVSEEEVKETEDKETKEDKEEKETTEDQVNQEDLFDPEGVGSGKEDEKEVREDTGSEGNSSNSSPNLYSSIAKALKDEGVFPDLEESSLSEIKSSEDFRNLVDAQIKAGLNERQKRIDEALGYGVEPDDIRRYENTINYLNSIKDSDLSEESDKGEKLRKELIYQDFINRGYSKERASREVQKSLNAGTDIEDAKEALKSNVDFFKEGYNNIIAEAKKETEKEEKQRKGQVEELKSSILEGKDLLGGIQLDKNTRQKVYDNILKPVYRDPDTGEYYTAIQKYEMENRVEFLKNLGIVYTLTDGFKNLDGLVKGKVRKEMKKGFKELERTLNNTSFSNDGNLQYITGVSADSESFIGKGWKLDV